MPLEYSLFSGWSAGVLCNGTADCVFSVTAPFSVTATFNQDTDHSVRIEGTTPAYYSTLQGAIDKAVTGASISAWALPFGESLVLSQPVALWLSGGYNGAYTAQTGVTILKGSLTVGNGSVVVDHLTINSQLQSR
jgi:hypothetical protein